MRCVQHGFNTVLGVLGSGVVGIEDVDARRDREEGGGVLGRSRF